MISCARCGTALTFQYVAERHQLSVTVGSLDHPDAVTPSEHYWDEARIPRLDLDDGLTRHARD
jgi:hypothetical protein